ncbi:MAG TPA: formate dehydrogenase subunit delta [Phenylobacterium sp.]
MPPDRLVHMANQIGRFFASQPGDASAAIADHLRAFWDPRMRAAIVAYVQADGEGLDPAAAAAVRRLALSD